MRRIHKLVPGGVSILTAFGCEGPPAPPPPDHSPPAPITDLRVIGQDHFSVELEWTATADGTRPASRYDVRVASEPITEATWDSARRVPVSWPGPPGSVDRVRVPFLVPCTGYSFAIRVLDTSSNESPLSNVVGDSTLDMSSAVYESALQGPNDVAVDRQGILYVADTYHSRILQVGPGVRRVWGGPGPELGRFSVPVAIAVGANGAYIVDKGNLRIQYWTFDGVPRWAWGGRNSDLFEQPVGIAVNSEEEVYVSDQKRGVFRFDSRGRLLGRWGEPGRATSVLRRPAGVATDSTGNVYVVDQLKYQVQVYSRVGTFMSQWGRQGDGDGEFAHPVDVVVDRDGAVLVSDAINGVIQRFTPGGMFLFKWRVSSSTTGQYPAGLGADSRGNTYVSLPPINSVWKYGASRFPCANSR